MGPFLKSLPTTLVFDHMACPNVREGVEGKHFQSWLKALDANPRWITKVTCPERFTVAGPPYDDVVPFAKAIVERFPDRVIWGTDWPHPNMPKEAPADGAIVGMVPQPAAPTSAEPPRPRAGQVSAPPSRHAPRSGRWARARRPAGSAARAAPTP